LFLLVGQDKIILYDAYQRAKINQVQLEHGERVNAAHFDSENMLLYVVKESKVEVFNWNLDFKVTTLKITTLRNNVNMNETPRLLSTTTSDKTIKMYFSYGFDSIQSIRFDKISDASQFVDWSQNQNLAKAIDGKCDEQNGYFQVNENICSKCTARDATECKYSADFATKCGNTQELVATVNGNCVPKSEVQEAKYYWDEGKTAYVKCEDYNCKTCEIVDNRWGLKNPKCTSCSDNYKLHEEKTIVLPKDPLEESGQTGK
jgi:hypothetical protein